MPWLALYTPGVPATFEPATRDLLRLFAAAKARAGDKLELAPGVDLGEDVLKRMEFAPKVTQPQRLTPQDIFA